MDAGHDLQSVYFDRGEPEFRASLIAESVELLESFFGAPCCTVVGLRKGRPGWEPGLRRSRGRAGLLTVLVMFRPPTRPLYSIEHIWK